MAHRWFRKSAAALLLCVAAIFGFHAVSAQQQYLVVNIVPGEKYEPVFEQVRDLAERDVAGRLQLGIGAIFSYLHQPRAQSAADVTEFLSLSERFEIPIIVQLDGEQWWEARPDLWNWWDPERPGFDPANRRNVEWSGWGPEYAMKIAWRNWGRQIRVLPPPNFMSQSYRGACHAEMHTLIPLILRWWENLPEGKKSLLIGIKLGWESAIGVNSFYMRDGNALLDFPEKEDPQVKLQGDRIPDRGVAAIGYAAVMTAQMADSGTLQEAHLAEIVRRHLDDLCALAANLGVPREKLFTHVGGWKEEEILYDAAFNSHSCPGWSFYRHAGDPAKDLGVQRVLGKSDAPYWAAAEWLLEGKNTLEAWHKALRRSLSDPKCRYLCVYNWSGIRDDPAAVDAIRRILHDQNGPPKK